MGADGPPSAADPGYSGRGGAVTVILAFGWLGCGGNADHPPPTVPVMVHGPTLPVEVLVDGEVVFSGLADQPENGLYQPSADGDCLASRRVGLFKGSNLYLEALFPGEVPEAGSLVLFPSTVDEAAGDWDIAGWRVDGDEMWGAYGGLATLGSFGPDGAEITLSDTTVCASDWLGSLDSEALWRDHTTDCNAGATVVFRTVEPPPFDVTAQTWCAAGRPGSWETPDGELLCSVDRLPCDVEVR